MRTTKRLLVLGVFFSAGLFALCTTTLLTDCKDASAPQVNSIVEAGAPAVENDCQLIENLTGSQALETVCASLPEVALLVSVVAPLILARSSTDAGTCKLIPTTNLCATPTELHQGISAILKQRRARFLVDAGLE